MSETNLVKILIEKRLRITTAESCTGGMIASRIINVPDASKVFDAGFITYADFAKSKFIEVSPELIEKYGVVSEEVAAAMANGAAKQSGADVAISTTGIAGPGGGTEKLPVGTVCFGYYVQGKTVTETCHFEGDRQTVREQAAAFAIEKTYGLLL